MRATEKDRVKIGDCFRGGDVVRSQVVSHISTGSSINISSSICLWKLSLGDARSYFVTTARNDLGVIFATSEAGESKIKTKTSVVHVDRHVGATLQPVSWQEMRCPKTGKIEKRKCAKPLELVDM